MGRMSFRYWLILLFVIPPSALASCDEVSAQPDSALSRMSSARSVDSVHSPFESSRAGRLIHRLVKSGLKALVSSESPSQNDDPSRAVPVPLSRPKAEIVAESAQLPAEEALISLAEVASPAKTLRVRTARIDLPVQRARTPPDTSQGDPGSGASLSPLITGPQDSELPSVGTHSISLQAALSGTLTSNPDLATLRLGNPTTSSAEAVEVARHFPTTLNPTLWCDLRPITLIPPNPFGGGGQRTSSFYHFGQFYFYLSLRQPVELGHQTTYRYRIAKATFEQQQWTIVQAELLALIQTYRFFQTAAYRRERLKIAREVADFNDRLLATLSRRLEANQVLAADVILAQVESKATRQLVKAAQQDYVTALTDLRNQIGIPESSAAIEPLGEFILPSYLPAAQEREILDMALACRADIQAAQAGVRGTKAAESLARADRIPSPVIGPQFAIDEAGIQYIGLVYITPIPVWNSGGPLLRQREADHRRAHLGLQSAQQRAVAQVRSTLAKWNGASELVKATSGFTSELAHEVEDLELLFNQGQTDLSRLTQAQQRLIQLRTAEVDAIWAATQAQADLLLSVGAPSLVHRMLSRAESPTAVPTLGKTSVTPPAAAPPASAPSPFGLPRNLSGRVTDPVAP